MGDVFHITAAAVLPAVPHATTGDADLVAATGLPRGAVRRFSRSGLQVAALLRQLGGGTEEPVVLASTHGESLSLEAFLDSFPTPSPLRFQTSVHPSPLQQARVAAQEPVRTYIPLCGEEGLALAALRAACSLDAPTALLLASEEAATWLDELGLATDTSFAFGLRLSRAATDAIGTLCWGAPDPAAPIIDSLSRLHAALSHRQALRLNHPDIGCARLDWS